MCLLLINWRETSFIDIGVYDLENGLFSLDRPHYNFLFFF